MASRNELLGGDHDGYYRSYVYVVKYFMIYD